jgi:hypothetical protein
MTAAGYPRELIYFIDSSVRRRKTVVPLLQRNFSFRPVAAMLSWNLARGSTTLERYLGESPVRWGQCYLHLRLVSPCGE